MKINFFIPSLRVIGTAICSGLLLGAVGCGGSGGGDNDNSAEVSGNWSGALTKAVDTCSIVNAPQTLQFSHIVSQNGDAVTVESSDGRTYLGNTLSNDGFSVDSAGASQIVNSVSCSVTRRIEYQNIGDPEDPTADVDVRLLRDCPGDEAGDCELAYTGTASRVGVVATPDVTATPNPSGTVAPGATAVAGTTPIAGGCAAINPRTTSGTYLGNGGCGISEVTYRVSQLTSGTSVILEPFGINGATSFSINTNNSATASSTRSDLTINSESGYSCALACSAPSTFTVNCFKEGGMSCIEKF